MKLILLAIPALLLTGAATAQNNAPSEIASGMAAEAPAKLSLDTPIESLMANEAARAVVEAFVPGLEGHPAYSQFKGMSLRAVQPFSSGMITDDMLTNIETGLAALS